MQDSKNGNSDIDGKVRRITIKMTMIVIGVHRISIQRSNHKKNELQSFLAVLILMTSWSSRLKAGDSFWMLVNEFRINHVINTFRLQIRQRHGCCRFYFLKILQFNFIRLSFFWFYADFWLKIKIKLNDFA